MTELKSFVFSLGKFLRRERVCVSEGGLIDVLYLVICNNVLYIFALKGNYVNSFFRFEIRILRGLMVGIDASASNLF